MAFSWYDYPAYEHEDDRGCEIKNLIRWSDDDGRAAERRERRRRLAKIESAIEKSRSILELGDDFDGEGSPGYLKETWERASSFLRQLAATSLDRFSQVAAAPYIDPGPNGSIDLHWKRATCELLVTVPADPNTAPTYYGDDYGKSVVKGSLDSDANLRVVVLWLLEHQG